MKEKSTRCHSTIGDWIFILALLLLFGLLLFGLLKFNPEPDSVPVYTNDIVTTPPAQDDDDELNDRLARIEQQLNLIRSSVIELDTTLHSIEERLDNTVELSQETGLSIQVIELIKSEADKYGYPFYIAFGLIDLESSFNPNLDHVNKDGTHDRGLWQLNDRLAPDLWADLYPNEKYDKSRLFDPIINTILGSYHLGYLYKSYTDIHEILTAYNKGINGLKTYINREGDAKSPYATSVISRSGKWRECR